MNHEKRRSDSDRTVVRRRCIVGAAGPNMQVEFRRKRPLSRSPGSAPAKKAVATCPSHPGSADGSNGELAGLGGQRRRWVPSSSSAGSQRQGNPGSCRMKAGVACTRPSDSTAIRPQHAGAVTSGKWKRAQSQTASCRAPRARKATIGSATPAKRRLSAICSRTADDSSALKAIECIDLRHFVSESSSSTSSSRP